MITDAELLRCYSADHSESAFTELVRRHIDLVYSAAARQMGGDAHRAKDVTQTVFADLARKAKVLTNHTSITGWLYTSTRFVAATARRTEERRRAREDQAQAMQNLLCDPGPDTDWDRLRSVLDDAMHELSKTDREAVLLRFFENKALTEVGAVCGLAENAARMRVERALEKLRLVLAERGVTSTTEALSSAMTTNAVHMAPLGLVATLASAYLAAPSPASRGRARLPGEKGHILQFNN